MNLKQLTRHINYDRWHTSIFSNYRHLLRKLLKLVKTHGWDKDLLTKVVTSFYSNEVTQMFEENHISKFEYIVIGEYCSLLVK